MNSQILSCIRLQKFYKILYIQQKGSVKHKIDSQKMQSDETFIEKTFEMINQLTGHVSLIPIKLLYLTNTREINISRAINDIHNNGQGLNLNNSLIFYLDNSKRLFVHIGTFPFSKQFELLLKFQLFLQTTIKIRYRKISNPNSPKNQNKNQKKLSAPLAKNKRTRVQKTIQQVQDLVKKWRNLFQMTDHNGKKLHTLESAAQKLGMQKKTLDDYYYKIKNAQANGFDFQKFKYQKIGVLRQFVKNQAKNNNKQKPASFPVQGFFGNNQGNSSIGFGNGVVTSFGNSFAPLPQKPPEDQIDKYFADAYDPEDESSSSDDSERFY